MRGVPLKVIQELIGQATIEMPLRYAHLAPEAQESAARQLDQPVPHLHAAPGRGSLEARGRRTVACALARCGWGEGRVEERG